MILIIIRHILLSIFELLNHNIWRDITPKYFCTITMIPYPISPVNCFKEYIANIYCYIICRKFEIVVDDMNFKMESIVRYFFTTTPYYIENSVVSDLLVYWFWWQIVVWHIQPTSIFILFSHLLRYWNMVCIIIRPILWSTF